MFIVRMISTLQNAKSKPTSKLLVVKSRPETGAAPRCRMIAYSLWKAKPARLEMNG
jgi:hypothetical protein